MYMGNRQYWDNKFKSRGTVMLAPDEEVIRCSSYFKSGSLLDIACGDGRNSVYLASEGYHVTGIDFSLEALKRLDSFATQNGLSIITKQIDMTRVDDLKSLGLFDTIIINHYRVQPDMLREVSLHLNTGGVLFVSGFGLKHQPNEKINENDLIRTSDFDNLANMTLIEHKTFDDERGSFFTIVFKKEA